MKRLYKFPILFIAVAFLTWACSEDTENTTPSSGVTVTGVTLTNVPGGGIALGAANPMSMQVQAAATPANAVDFDKYYFRYYSDNISVFTVDDQGIITAQATGEGVLTVVARNNSAIKTTCKVTVGTINKTAVTIAADRKNVQMATKTVFYLKDFVQIDPSKATVKTLKYTSSDPAIAYVDATGIVSAIAPGTATIRVEAGDNSAMYDQCTVTVGNIPVESITLQSIYHNIDFEVGNYVTVGTGVLSTYGAVIAPGNATTKAVTYTSSNPAVATVSSTGLILAVGLGSTVVRISSTDGSGVYADINVRVSIFDYNHLNRANWSIIASSPTSTKALYGGGPVVNMLDATTNDTSGCFVKAGATLEGVSCPAGTTLFFTLDMKEPKSFNYFSLTHRMGAGTYGPYKRAASLTLYGSDDNVNYKLIQAAAAVPWNAASPDGVTTTKLSQKSTCRYVRVEIIPFFAQIYPDEPYDMNYVLIKDFQLGEYVPRP